MSKNKTITTKTIIKKDEKGQALLFVVVAVTIALAVGVSVSTRTLSSQKRVSSSDSATRVANAAEGGAEAALGKTYSVLSSLTSPSLTTAACQGYGFSTSENGKCVMNYPSSPGDKITTKATISVKTFTTNASDYYWFDLNLGTVKEIKLVDYPAQSWASPSHGIYVCWDNKNAAIYAFSYDQFGKDMKKEYFVGSDFNNSSNISGFTTATETNGHSEYAGCGRINLVSSPYGLRIKTLYEKTRVFVYPGSTGSFPIQGYKIASVGELTSGGESDVKETRIVVVYKSFPYASSILDAGMYSATGVIN